MKILFDEYGDTLLNAIISLISLMIVVVPSFNHIITTNVDSLKPIISSSDINAERQIITIANFEVDDSVIMLGNEFDYMQYVRASNSKGEDIKEYVNLLYFPNIDKKGEYELIYLLRYNGETMAIKSKLYVME